MPPGGSVTVIGAGRPEVALGMRQLCPDPAKLRIEGEGERHVPFERIIAAYAEPWTAGLALFPDSPHVRAKELTKFFEYMAAGLPIVCSDFPVWRELIEGTGAGICVDPADSRAVREAVPSLAADSARARAMGEAGRAAVRSRFSWTSEAQRLVALYHRLVPIPAARARKESQDRCPEQGRLVPVPGATAPRPAVEATPATGA